ncbi:MAG: hypothetical protein M0R75_14670 [Dehalococcoidia bacterium]|nr:hypothetical protein [Dehalococcoidia bacterium]
MTSQREDSQAGMFDHVVFDEELEAACRLIADEETRKVVGEYEAAVTLRREKVRAMEATLRDKFGEGAFEQGGARVRCGDFVLTVKRRTGGGFEMPEWESVGVASQEAAR